MIQSTRRIQNENELRRMEPAFLSAGDTAWRLVIPWTRQRDGIHDKDGVRLHQLKSRIGFMYPEYTPYYWLVGFMVCLAFVFSTVSIF